MTEHLIARSDAAVGETPLVERIRTDADSEVLVLCPLSVFPDADRELQFTALVLCRQGVPIVDVEVGIVTLDMQLTTFGATHHNIYSIGFAIHSIEVQRGDLRRHRHTDIVRIDSRQLIDNRRILHLTSTT